MVNDTDGKILKTNRGRGGTNRGAVGGLDPANSEPANGAGAGAPTDGPGSGSNFDGAGATGAPIAAAAPPVETGPEAAPSFPVASVSTPKRKRRTDAEIAAARAAGEKSHQKKADPTPNAQAATTAAMLVEVAEQLAVAFAGEGARLESAERLLISSSLPKVLERMTPEVARQIETVSYPLMLAAGVGAYSIRVMRLLGQQAAAKREAAASPEIHAAPGSNGASEPEPVTLAGGVDRLATADGRAFLNPRGV